MLYLVKVRVYLEKLPEFGAKLQRGEFDNYAIGEQGGGLQFSFGWVASRDLKPNFIVSF